MILKISNMKAKSAGHDHFTSTVIVLNEVTKSILDCLLLMPHWREFLGARRCFTKSGLEALPAYAIVIVQRCKICEEPKANFITCEFNFL